jgi:hypothetical protein
MTAILGTTSGFYYKDNFQLPWQTITTAAKADYIGQWASLGQSALLYSQRANKNPIFFGRGTINETSYIPNHNLPYLHKTLDSSMNSKFGTAIHCGCEHAGRLLISENSTIWYSEPLDLLNGLDSNYVNVGQTNDKITGLYNLNGNLYVLKQGSIWGMGGDYSELTSQQFRRIISGCGSSYHVNCVADGKIFFGNPAGLYVVGGREAVYLSKPIEQYWKDNFDPHQTFLSFWNYKKWLFVRFKEENTVFILDLTSMKWWAINEFDMTGATDSPIMEPHFLFCDSESNCVYILEFRTAGSDSLVQYVQTPFVGLSNPYETKYLSRIFINGTGVDWLGYTTRSEPNSSGSGITWIHNPGGEAVFPQTAFKEISIILYGSGSMILRNVAVEYQARRI